MCIQLRLRVASRYQRVAETRCRGRRATAYARTTVDARDGSLRPGICYENEGPIMHISVRV